MQKEEEEREIQLHKSDFFFGKETGVKTEEANIQVRLRSQP